MKKKIFDFLLVALIIPLVLSGCGVTPMAHVKFQSETGVVIYTNGHLYESGPSIYYFDTEEDSQSLDYLDFSMSIQFLDETFGKETLNGVECESFYLSNHPEIHICLNKSKALYDAQKNIYLNGTKLTPYQTNDFDNLFFFTFRNVNFVRANTDCSDNEFINVIEYK